MLRSLITTGALALTAAAALNAQSASVYDKLAEQVDKKPDFLLLWNFEGDMDYLAGKATEYLQAYAMANPEAGIPPLDLRPFANILGLTCVDGFAMSSKDLGGQYQSTSFIYMPRGPQGLMSIFGTQNAPLSLGDFAPADSMLAVEMELDTAALRGMVETIASTVMGDMGRSIVQQKLAEPLGPTALTAEQVLRALDGKVMFLLNMGQNDEGMQTLSFAVRLENAGPLLAQLQPTIEMMGGGMVTFTSGANGELRADTPEFPAGELAPMTFNLMADAQGGLLLAGGTGFLDHVISASTPKLKTVPAFAAAMKSLPKEGLALSYMAPEYYHASFKPVLDELQTEEDPMAQVVLMAFGDFLAKFDQPQVALSYMVDGGMKTVQFSDLSVEESLALIPVGIGAAVAIPAMKKAREQAEDMSVENNLRMIAAAADQYFIETGETTISYQELVEMGYISEIEPMAGESYEMTIEQGFTELSVELEDGSVVTYEAW